MIQIQNELLEEFFTGLTGKFYGDWNLIIKAAKALKELQQSSTMVNGRLNREFLNRLLFLDDAITSYNIDRAFGELFESVAFYKKWYEK